MEILKTDSYHCISPSENEIQDKENGFQIFFDEFLKNNANLKSINVIVDISKIINIDLHKILLFSPINENHKSNNTSFVIVCNGIEFDKMPDELVAVPTFKEAEDIIEIEDIERDLGF